MKAVKKFLKFCFLPFALVNRIIPKNSRCIFFYSNLGFRDNVKSLYDYLIENNFNKQFQIIVATDEFRIFQSSAPENVRFVGLLRGVLFFLRSKFCFYSFGKYPIKPASGQIVVNLWHGMPLKGIGKLEKGHENDDQNYFTKILATSPFFADIMCRAFGAERGQALIAPQPRCDVFLKQTQKPVFFSNYDKVIFWLPTFLSSKRLGKTEGVYYEEISPYDTCFLDKLDPFLKEKNILLVIKPHPLDDVCLPKRPFQNILFITEQVLSQKGLTLYEILKHSDALITDFSSIYFDYLMLHRPIAFACPNPVEYGERRGFVTDDIAALMPGCHIYTVSDFLNFVSDVADGKDKYSEKRNKVNEICNSKSGISGCEYILKEIRLTKSEEK